MLTYKDVEVWVEDSQHLRPNHQTMSIDLIDGRTVTGKIELMRDEFYTIHCQSPVSVFCDVYAITSLHMRPEHAARFLLDKTIAISKNASGSSADHTEGRFRDHGLRTPKRTFQQGRLGSVEVEIRRVAEFIKGEPQEEWADDGGAVEFLMIDDFGQPPWLVFHFDIVLKKLRPPASTIKHVTKRVLPRNQSRAMNGGQPACSSTEGQSTKPMLHSLKKGHKHKRHSMRHGSAQIAEAICTNSDQLQKEYKKEEAEEQRLLQKLQDLLENKKTRNMELRRMLGEIP